MRFTEKRAKMKKQRKGLEGIPRDMEVCKDKLPGSKARLIRAHGQKSFHSLELPAS